MDIDLIGTESIKFLDTGKAITVCDLSQAVFHRSFIYSGGVFDISVLRIKLVGLKVFLSA